MALGGRDQPPSPSLTTSHSTGVFDDSPTMAWEHSMRSVLEFYRFPDPLIGLIIQYAVAPLSISAGSDYLLVRFNDGSVRVMGDKDDPEISFALDLDGMRALAIAAGRGCLFVVLENKNVFYFNLDDMHRVSSRSLVNLDGKKARAIDSGVGQSLALMDDGTVWLLSHQCGSSLDDGLTIDQFWIHPIDLGVADVKAVASSGSHSLLLLNNGTAWAFGNNSYGQLGDAETGYRGSPAPIVSLRGLIVVAIAVGFEHSLVLLKDGGVLAFGRNNHGQLGIGSSVACKPVYLMADVCAIAAGDYHSWVLLNNGNVLGFGRNRDGELGDGTTTDRYAPVPVKLGGKKAKAIAAKGHSSVLLLEDETIVAFGLYTPKDKHNTPR
jgi:alpha-tubulin suppressor-like RCC1 family protein